ncbi:hypothetical protein MICAF_2370012 [Microcystis aeruginosa PCC 9807]|uniref:Uncharacterized protein n=1 Tax=Microcystis aeruginosa PCC 9807 TaxID=1160283 RepID=I4H4J4_MICAE|nr:PLP-dependent transferase [Microcystis aeruginosa]CCI16968.1 hypothetical protein MICAF_2370012 [Microcystis aeruginosa PCC 9807]
MEFETRAIHGAVTVPIYLGSYEYSRTGNPMRWSLDEQEKKALFIAYFLANHPKIDRVYYPSLPSHPQHSLARH